MIAACVSSVRGYAGRTGASAPAPARATKPATTLRSTVVAGAARPDLNAGGLGEAPGAPAVTRRPPPPRSGLAAPPTTVDRKAVRSAEHPYELQSQSKTVCRPLLA